MTQAGDQDAAAPAGVTRTGAVDRDLPVDLSESGSPAVEVTSTQRGAGLSPAGSARPATVSRGPRPEMPDPGVLTALVAATDQLLAPVSPAGSARGAPPTEDHTAWRFSARWWSKPPVLRRDRPSAWR